MGGGFSVQVNGVQYIVLSCSLQHPPKDIDISSLESCICHFMFTRDIGVFFLLLSIQAFYAGFVFLSFFLFSSFFLCFFFFFGGGGRICLTSSSTMDQGMLSQPAWTYLRFTNHHPLHLHHPHHHHHHHRRRRRRHLLFISMTWCEKQGKIVYPDVVGNERIFY